jgi:hypothetical protein
LIVEGLVYTGWEETAICSTDEGKAFKIQNDAFEVILTLLEGLKCKDQDH